jgi:HEAT repeat protein
LRRAALIGLARLDDHDALPAMTALLEDRNQTVRDTALLSLGLVRHEKAKRLLLQAAGDRSSMPDYLRAFAVISLSLSRTEGTAALLRSLALDAACPAEIRAMALEGLGMLGGPDNVKFLLDFVANEDRLAPAAVNALGRSGDTVACPMLVRLLFADTAAVRRAAALALGSTTQPEEAGVLKRLNRCARHTSDPVLRGFCLISMGRISGCKAVDQLLFYTTRGRKSDTPWACIGLGLALRDAPDERMEERLVRIATGHGNRSTRGAAVIALGLMRSRNAVDPLAQILERGDDPCLRGYCALALGMIGHEKGNKPLRLFLKKKGLPQVTTQCALGLGLLGDVNAVPDLVDRLLESDNDCTKAYSALGLSYMGRLDLVTELSRVIGEGALDDLTLMHCINLTTKLLSGWKGPYLDGFARDSNPAADYPLVDYLLEFDL